LRHGLALLVAIVLVVTFFRHRADRRANGSAADSEAIMKLAGTSNATSAKVPNGN
jgi:hypothetical protein